MASFFSENYKQCSCGNKRLVVRHTVLLTTKNEEVDKRIEYVCPKCDNIILSKNEKE